MTGTTGSRVFKLKADDPGPLQGTHSAVKLDTAAHSPRQGTEDKNAQRKGHPVCDIVVPWMTDGNSPTIFVPRCFVAAAAAAALPSCPPQQSELRPGRLLLSRD